MLLNKQNVFNSVFSVKTKNNQNIKYFILIFFIWSVIAIVLLFFNQYGCEEWDKQGCVNVSLLMLWAAGVIGLFSILLYIQGKNYSEKAQEEIVNEKYLLRTLINNLPDAIYVLDSKCRKLIANKADLINIGVDSEKDVIGKTDLDVFPEEVAVKFYEADLAVIKNNKPIVDVIEHLVNSNGDERWLSTSKFPILNEKGEVTGLVGIGRDITEQRKVKQALSKAKQNLNLHIENTPLAVLELNTNFKIVQWNKSAERIFGYSIEEVKGEDGEIIFSKDEIVKFKKEWSALLAQPESKQVTINNIKKNGEIIICTWHNTPLIDSDGNVFGVAAMIQDVTVMKQVELERERYIKTLTQPLDDSSQLSFNDLFDLNEIQQVQDQFAKVAGVASIITDVNGTPITKGSNFCDLCNIIRKTEKGAINCKYSDYIIGGSKSDGVVIQPCLSGGLWDAGVRITVGEKHIANWLVGQVKDETKEDAKILEYVQSIGGNISDAKVAVKEVKSMSIEKFREIGDTLKIFAKLLSSIAYQNVQQARFINKLKETEKKIALKNNELTIAEEEVRGVNEKLMLTNQALYDNMVQLEEAKEKAEEANHLKSTFLASMSHEIRTPLNAIVGFSSIIAQDPNNSENSKFSVIINKQTELLLQLVNDILDFSKIEAGTIEINQIHFNINNIIKDIYNVLNSKSPSGVELVPQRLEVPLIIISDEIRIKQIFTNLISNAIKFTQSGTITFGFELDEHSEIIGFVKDTGIGIPFDKQKTIFERFTKLDKLSQGTGLGLSIVQSLIELMKGKFWLESELGKGSSFYFKIPFEIKY